VPRESRVRALEVLTAAARLGTTSFGGPIAHLGYFREEYVRRRGWLDDRGYADLVALAQLLPGPASSQVGIGVGTLRAGPLGGVLAWLGFTLPSALLLVLFAWGVQDVGEDERVWLHGLQVVAVSVVAYAVWMMARTLTPDRTRIAIALAAAVVVLAWASAAAQVVVIAAGAVAGLALLRRRVEPGGGETAARVGRRLATVSLALFVALLAGLPILAAATEDEAVEIVDSFYRAGSLVFGGGHVVLPLLEAEVVEPGWVSPEDFVAGYGAAQAVPGPLFTFAAYLGFVMEPEPNGVAGAAIATAAIFLPSILLVFGALPLFGAVRRRASFASALAGVNAAVVGLLLAALYRPVFTSAIERPEDFGLAAACLALLAVWKLPPLAVVVAGALGGAAIAQWA
jgi:chromate transporter